MIFDEERGRISLPLTFHDGRGKFKEARTREGPLHSNGRKRTSQSQLGIGELEEDPFLYTCRPLSGKLPCIGLL